MTTEVSEPNLLSLFYRTLVWPGFGIVLCFPDQEANGATSLLKKYVQQICRHIAEVFPVATEIAAEGSRHFAAVVAVLKADVIG